MKFLAFVSMTFVAVALALTAQAGPGEYHGGGGFHGGGYPGGGFHGGGYPGGGYRDGGYRGGGFRRGGGFWQGGVWQTYPAYGRCGWDGYYCDDGYVSGVVVCAPQMVESNVATTERTLNILASTSEFANAKTFKSELAQVAALKNAGEKAQAYLQLAGIDSNDKSAVAGFVGSRDAKGAWITDLQRNGDLTSAQAESVASKLQTALRGNLQ